MDKLWYIVDNTDENLIGVDVSKYLSKAKWNKTIGKLYFCTYDFIEGAIILL